nr:integrase, catalytic region, zinc finger, CCHC-type, peptidase aspartic, catalytic [Tanacetum cinerariifolium]
MVADLRYFNSLELEVDSLKSQLETQKTLFLNEIDRLSREYCYADHMNAVLGVYTELDEVTNLQCDYLETLEKCKCLEKELSKSKMMSTSFEALQKHAINIELDLQQIILFIVNSGCSKHMTGNLKLLTNFVEKFLGSVKFGNDQIAPIIRYGDLNDIVIGLPKLKFVKDYLCSSCELGKAKPGTVTTSNELDFLFSPMFDELLNGSTQLVSKSSDVTTADAPNLCQQQYTTPLNTQTTPEPTYHPLEQVIGNPSQSVRTRRHLESDGEMCMFILTVSRTEPKNIKETMADSAWIESMQKELHQFDRLDPDGFIDPYHPDKVYRLKKALYGLKQDPRA